MVWFMGVMVVDGRLMVGLCVVESNITQSNFKQQKSNDDFFMLNIPGYCS